MTRPPRILYAEPPTLDKRIELATAIRMLAGPDRTAQQRPPECAAVRRELEEIAFSIQELLRDCDRRLRSYVIKYSPDQPRAPAGNPDGGQWTRDGGNGNVVGGSDGEIDNRSALGRKQYAALGTLTNATDSGSEPARSNGVQLTMEPNDPVTGRPFWSENPIDRLGGGEGGGGLGEQSNIGSSEAAAAGAQGFAPPQIGSFQVPENLTYGTTLFGNYAHDEIANILKDLYPGVTFEFNVLPGQRGIDVTVLNDPFGRVSYQYGEIKPLTASGESRFIRQLQEWGVGPVQSITYDAAGNVYYGFR
jgi:hypothetical protein